MSEASQKRVGLVYCRCNSIIFLTSFFLFFDVELCEFAAEVLVRCTVELASLLRGKVGTGVEGVGAATVLVSIAGGPLILLLLFLGTSKGSTFVNSMFTGAIFRGFMTFLTAFFFKIT